MEIVYHESESGNIEELRAHTSTHQKECIYATPKKVVALLFASQGNRDLDTCVSTRNKHLEIVERRSGVLKTLYDKEGYIYELDGSTFKHYDYLWSLEVISFESSIKPLNKIYIPNLLEAITEEEKMGNITIYRYPYRPESIPLDNSDLIDKYINYENSGLIGAINDLLKIYPEFTEIVQEKQKQKNM